LWQENTKNKKKSQEFTTPRFQHLSHINLQTFTACNPYDTATMVGKAAMSPYNAGAHTKKNIKIKKMWNISITG
jgi:hypothetical protein